MVRALFLLVLIAVGATARAQGVPADSARAGSARAVPQASAAADTTRPVVAGVPLALPAEGGLDQPVTYTARDSVRIEIAPRAAADSSGAPGDVVTLYGAAEAKYQTATITAALLQYNAGAQTLRAEPFASDSGDVGVPAFTDGEESFTGRLFTYNLTTRRGRVTGARTQIQDGFLLGGIIKQADAHVIYAQNAAYTTCELDHPHYSLVGSSRVDLQACKLEYSIVSPK